MTGATPLFVGPCEVAALRDLAERAAKAPVDVRGLVDRLRDPDAKAAHMAQMTAQTVELPPAWLVTYSVEIGHPVGTARHMSISVQRPGRVPNPHAVWLVAEVLGFEGSLEQCKVWLEELEGHGNAINVVQPVQTHAEARA